MKKYFINFIELIVNIYWEISLFVIRKRLQKKEYPIIPLGVDDQIIIIVPHADDEWIACSTIISKNKNVILLYMNMEGGDDDCTHMKRELELREIARMHNIKLVVINDNKVDALVNQLHFYKPSYVFIPFLFDWHEEHIQCMRFLQQALSVYHKELNIAMYQVSLPIAGTNMITHISTMSRKEWDLKWATFKKVYKSQNMIPYKRFALYERALRFPVGYYAAEAYSIKNSTQWVNNLDNWILTDPEKIIAKQSLNNVVKSIDLMVEFKKKREWKN